MRVRQSLPVLRHMFPGPRLAALGALLCAASLGLLAFAGRLPGGDAPLFFLQGAALVAGAWWLLLGSPLCLLVCCMAPLRLPGTARLLRRGVLMHLALSVLLPLLALCGWLPAGVDAVGLAAALWLGSATGLLIVSLPMAVPIVPLAIFMGDGALLADPAWCGLLGSAALCLSGLAWHWQLARSRAALWAPAGVALAGSSRQLSRLLSPMPGAGQRSAHRAANPAVPLAGRDALAALLGPACQTMRQMYGRRGRWWAYLVFAGTALVLLGWAAIRPSEPAGGSIFLSAMMVAALLLVARGPASRLAAIQRPGLAELAELRLVPGMPGAAQLPAALMRQMLCCLGERLALAAIALSAAASLTGTMQPLWLWWWPSLAGLALLLGLATAWLALQGRSRNWWWLGTTGLAAVLAIATHVHLLVHGRPLDAAWLTAWGAWAGLAALVFGVLCRPVARGPMGAFHLGAARR